MSDYNNCPPPHTLQGARASSLKYHWVLVKVSLQQGLHRWRQGWEEAGKSKGVGGRGRHVGKGKVTPTKGKQTRYAAIFTIRGPRKRAAHFQDRPFLISYFAMGVWNLEWSMGILK